MNAKRGFVADLLTQKEVPEKKGRCNRVCKLKPSSARLIVTSSPRLRAENNMYLILTNRLAFCMCCCIVIILSYSFLKAEYVCDYGPLNRTKNIELLF
jgi:hypothetical protein